MSDHISSLAAILPIALLVTKCDRPASDFCFYLPLPAPNGIIIRHDTIAGGDDDDMQNCVGSNRGHRRRRQRGDAPGTRFMSAAAMILPSISSSLLRLLVMVAYGEAQPSPHTACRWRCQRSAPGILSSPIRQQNRQPDAEETRPRLIVGVNTPVMPPMIIGRNRRDFTSSTYGSSLVDTACRPEGNDDRAAAELVLLRPPEGYAPSGNMHASSSRNPY